MIYNITVPAIRNNVDLCLLNGNYDRITRKSFEDASIFIALGELKGGIDPAGADEHWKTARTALGRIHDALAKFKPATFFIGAAIEEKMAEEIWKLLKARTITNAANLTDEKQLASMAQWICAL